MLRPEKQQLVEELSDKLSRAKAFFLTDYSGLNVEKISDLRRRFRSKSVEYFVVKNKLTRLALKNIGIDTLDDSLIGPTAIAFSYEDPAAPAKIISEFVKEFREVEKPTIKIGMVENEVLTTEQMVELINLPTREVLISMVLSGINGPLSGLVGSLNGVLSKLVLTLKALEEKKAEA